MGQVQRALISVSDKRGVVEFAQGLVALGVEILSTGGTARTLQEAGVPVVEVSEYTGFPEMMEGRVKTLHPKIHGGILARRDRPEDMAQAQAHGIRPIDLVVVNLYPFRETVQRPGVSWEEAIEHIDIGGPTLIRAAAKNHAFVGVVTDPDQYEPVLEELRTTGQLSEETRRRLAYAAFVHTAEYDAAIADYFSRQLSEEPEGPPKRLTLSLHRLQALRYGENPHQQAAFYRIVGEEGPWTQMEQLHGRELSYNNILDADAAWSTVWEFSEPTCAIIKHANPCGLASREDPAEAFRRAFQCDPISAFGGIIAFNCEVDEATARAIRTAKHPTSGQRLFVEIVMAPDFSETALERLRRSPNLRILRLPPPEEKGWRLRSVAGAVLVQSPDTLEERPEGWRVVTRRQPDPEEWPDILFAWKAVKHVKSNAIVVVKDQALLGMGAGQPNRIESARLALQQAGVQAGGAVLASDAMFPFGDAVALGLAYGIRTFVQPGGSIRDEDSIRLADAGEAAMIFTGVRHFWH
ncbi:MAG: bifunctional purine biosynthesis protein PurH [Candidatus Poribacteria bacterium]|nr:MAG: bifunctional purine biosynthesis protein PurH [Candidatus Poribacteria bacterium]